MPATTSDHRFSSIQDAKAFALAGNAIITLQSIRTGNHYTFKVTSPSVEKQEKRGFAPEQVWFVKLLTDGSADDGCFHYLGMIKDGRFFATPASAQLQTSSSFKAFAFFFGSQELHPELVIMHCNHCGHCGKTLTEPESISCGYGPTCREKLGIVI
jgi:hypothetical protein